MFSFYYDTDGSLHCMKHDKTQRATRISNENTQTFLHATDFIIKFYKMRWHTGTNMEECVNTTQMPPLPAKVNTGHNSTTENW